MRRWLLFFAIVLAMSGCRGSGGLEPTGKPAAELTLTPTPTQTERPPEVAAAEVTPAGLADQLCDTFVEYATASAAGRNVKAAQLVDAAEAAVDLAADAPSWQVTAEAAAELADWEDEGGFNSPYGSQGFAVRQAALADLEVACAQWAATGQLQLKTLPNGKPDPARIHRSEPGAADAVLSCWTWVESYQVAGLPGAAADEMMANAVAAARRAAEASGRWAELYEAMHARAATMTVDGSAPDAEGQMDRAEEAMRRLPEVCQLIVHLPRQLSGG